jgi:hypothetical protein
MDSDFLQGWERSYLPVVQCPVERFALHLSVQKHNCQLPPLVLQPIVVAMLCLGVDSEALDVVGHIGSLLLSLYQSKIKSLHRRLEMGPP